MAADWGAESWLANESIIYNEVSKEKSLCLNLNSFFLIKAVPVEYNLVTHYKGMHQASKVDRQNAKFHLLKSYIVHCHK